MALCLLFWLSRSSGLTGGICAVAEDNAFRVPWWIELGHESERPCRSGRNPMIVLLLNIDAE
jgi:hypothetical protein